MKVRQGISLVVLVITIIVMIILAGAIILTLNNNGIINKASYSVEETNLDTIKEMAEVAWGEAYLLEEVTTDEEYDIYVKGVLQQNNITEEDYEGYILQATTSGVEFVPKVVLPEGAVYYVGVNTREYKDYSSATAVYRAGDILPIVSDGDIYVYGDYIYRYNYEAGTFSHENNPKGLTGATNGWCQNKELNGWGVVYVGETATPGKILPIINNKPVVTMTYAFSDFIGGSRYQTPIVDASNIDIPETVTDISGAFEYCVKLEVAPIVPSGVLDMSYTFSDCENLTGTITINANPVEYRGCFINTEKPIELTGTSTLLNELAATSSKGNVTVLK